MSDHEQIQKVIREAFAAAGVSLGQEIAPAKFAAYLDLLQRWNLRLSLSSIRESEEIIERHFVESAFVAQHLPSGTRTLLDYGSGAGFPGIPIAICRPDIQVTLAEAHGKKASFLREAVRIADVSSNVYDGRVEKMPVGSYFDVITMRAVEKMDKAVPIAATLTRNLAVMTTEQAAAKFVGKSEDLQWSDPLRLPNTRQGILLFGCKRK